MRPLPLAASALLAFCTSSCKFFKPKEEPAAAYDPYGQQSNPYGQAPASNPYGQAAAPAPNPYGQTAAPNPYGSYEQPPAPTAGAPSTYPPSSAAPYAGSASGGRSVTVQSGDTLTSIAKRNGTSVAALRSANGLSGDLIKIGQKLNLP